MRLNSTFIPSNANGAAQCASGIFPEAQIFVTTHSPLTALQQILRSWLCCEKALRGCLVKDPPDFSGFSVLEMLTDDRLFGTEGFRPQVSKALQKYYRLANKEKGSRSRQEMRALYSVSRKLMDAELSKEPESPLLQELQSLLSESTSFERD